MPANVPAASPTTVLPAHLSRAFERQQYWTVDENEYANGERQSKVGVATPIVSWKITAHLSAAQEAAILAFLEARKFTEPFYFYDGTETSPKWSHDPSGVVSVGRYVVVAKGNINRALGLGRRNLMNLTLEQRA